MISGIMKKLGYAKKNVYVFDGWCGCGGHEDRWLKPGKCPHCGETVTRIGEEAIDYCQECEVVTEGETRYG